jgi:hypothetical protein
MRSIVTGAARRALSHFEAEKARSLVVALSLGLNFITLEALAP